MYRGGSVNAASTLFWPSLGRYGEKYKKIRNHSKQTKLQGKSTSHFSSLLNQGQRPCPQQVYPPGYLKPSWNGMFLTNTHYDAFLIVAELVEVEHLQPSATIPASFSANGVLHGHNHWLMVNIAYVQVILKITESNAIFLVNASSPVS
jgi:hypothetical protein